MQWKISWPSVRSPYSRDFLVKSEKVTISLSDLALYNFDTLINQIPNTEDLHKEMNKKYVEKVRIEIIFLIILFSLGIIEEGYLYFVKDYLRLKGFLLIMSITFLFSNMRKLLLMLKIKNSM